MSAVIRFMIENNEKLIQYYNIFIDETYKNYSREEYYEAMKIYYDICQKFDYETYTLIMDLIKIMDKKLTHKNLNMYFPILV